MPRQHKTGSSQLYLCSIFEKTTFVGKFSRCSLLRSSKAFFNVGVHYENWLGIRDEKEMNPGEEVPRQLFNRKSLIKAELSFEREKILVG